MRAEEPFPTDNPWNQAIDKEPLDTELMASVMPGMALATGVHPDWGTATDNYGIPITVGKAAAPALITWNTSYGPDESDKLACALGPFCYPIPLDAKIEGGPSSKTTSDRHVLFLANDGAPDHCVLYELYNTQTPTGASFTAASGAIWKLDSNMLRSSNWYVSGESDNAWEPEMDALLSKLGQVRGSDFEIVKTGSLVFPPR